MKIAIIETALKEYGVKETQGIGNTPKVLEYFKEAGHGWVKDDTNYAWCSAFINYVCKKAGMEFTRQLNARSWLTIGKEIKKPEIGDIVIFWRNKPDSAEGHVGIYIKEDETNIWVLGGNQSDQVSIAPYPKERLLGYRDITQKVTISLPLKELKKGDKGNEVKLLQKVLGITQDGDFGPVTEKVLKHFQKNYGLPITGIANKKTLSILIKY
jgi:uncharacterized protein (TIGR02594 family)